MTSFLGCLMCRFHDDFDGRKLCHEERNAVADRIHRSNAGHYLNRWQLELPGANWAASFGQQNISADRTKEGRFTGHVRTGYQEDSSRWSQSCVVINTSPLRDHGMT